MTILGASNVGKSTLLNKLVGAKVSIVSPKVQTTRMRILGISIKHTAQIIFVDTPGIFSPRRRLDRAMITCAWNSTNDADELLLIVDATRGFDNHTQIILDKLKDKKTNIILAFNKIDRVKKQKLLRLASEMNKATQFSATFMVSALNGEGVDDLLCYIASKMKPGPWLFPKDQISEMPQRLLAAEITREKIYLRLHQELPYKISVETETWEKNNDGSIKIRQLIFVEKHTQKAIVLGKNGRQIKEIGELSRKDLTNLLGKRIHLFLFVKVRENWSENYQYYQNLGLNFNA